MMFADYNLEELLPQKGMETSHQGQQIIDLQNRMIKNLGVWVNKYTPAFVREALLSYNDLSSIDALDRFKEMRKIYANHNYISKVRLSLDKLEVLELASNAMLAVPNLAAMPRLKVLNLVRNKIKQIDVDFLPLTNSLERVYLAQNEIEFYSRGTMRAWVANMKKMNKLQEMTIHSNPFVEEYTNYKTLLFDGVKSLEILDGDRKKDVSKSQTELQRREEQDDEADQLASKQTKGGGKGGKRVMQVQDLQSVFNVLLRSVEMINYNRANALIQMHNLSNFIDEFIALYQERGETIKKGNPVRCMASIASFLQNVQLIVDEVAEIRSPMLYNLCKLAVMREFSFGIKCLEILNDFMSSGSSLQQKAKEFVSNQLIPQIDNNLEEVAQPLLEGLVRLVSNDSELAEQLYQYIKRFKDWLQLIDDRIIQGSEANFQLFNSAIKLIGVMLKDQVENVAEFMRLRITEVISNLLTHTKQKGGNQEREIGLLMIIENCCNAHPKAAQQFIQTDVVTAIAKPIMDIFRERKKKVDKDSNTDHAAILKVKHYAKHIDAFSSLLTDQFTMKQMMKSKTSPIAPLIQVLFHANEDALVITSICNLAVKVIRNPAFITNMDYMEEFLMWMDNSVNLMQFFDGAAYHELCTRERILDHALNVLHNEKVQNLIVAIINLISVISEKANHGIRPFEKASQALNDNYRQNLLFSCLAIPSDFVKLAVVRCLYNVKLEEFDKEEINNLVELIKSYKNVGAGQTEKVLSFIFYILAKLTYALVKKNLQTFQRSKIQGTYYECVDILLRNQKRNVEDSEQEAEEKTTLSISCVYFLQCASRVQNIAWKPTEDAAANFVKILSAEEQFSNIYFDQAIEIEQTWMGKHLRFLLKALTDSLIPFTRVSLRVIQKIADLLENKPQKRLRNPLNDHEFYKKLFDDIHQSEKNRYAKEKMTWMEIGGIANHTRPEQDEQTEIVKEEETADGVQIKKGLHESEAYIQWTQQHRAFVDYGIELLLMFLEGRIRAGKGQTATDQAKQEMKELMAEQFASKVDRQIKQYESEELKRQEEMELKQEAERLGMNEKTEEEKVSPSELVKENMRLQKLEIEETKKGRVGFGGLLMKFSTNESDEFILSVAAMLRCFYVALEKAPVQETKEHTIKLLQQPYILKIITGLCKKTGWIDGYVGVKFLRVISHLMVPPTELGLNSFKMLNLLDTVSMSMKQILQKVQFLLMKEQQSGSNQRSDEMRNFLYDVAMIGYILVKECASFHFSEMKVKRGECEAHKTQRKPQARVIDYVLGSVYSIDEIKTFLAIVFQEKRGAPQNPMSGNEEGEEGEYDEDDDEQLIVYNQDGSAHRAEQLKDEVTRYYITMIVGEYMDKCAALKYEILENIMQASVFEKKKLRKSYLQELLNSQKKARLKTSLISYLHKPKFDLLFDPTQRQKLHTFAHADVAPLSSNSFSKRIIVLTNAGLYILKPPKGEPCPIEGPSQFCRSSPTLDTSFHYEQIEEIIDFYGSEQLLLIKLKTETALSDAKQPSAFFLMRFDQLFVQRQILSVLQNLSIFSQFKFYTDFIFQRAIEHKINRKYYATYLVTLNPGSVLNIFNFLKEPVLIPNCSLAVITSENVFILNIDWEKWIHLGFNKTMEQEANFKTSDETDTDSDPYSTPVEEKSKEEIAYEKKKKKCINNMMKQKSRIESRSAKFFVQTSTAPILRIEGSSSSNSLKFGCDFGRQQFQIDIQRAASFPSEPLS